MPKRYLFVAACVVALPAILTATPQIQHSGKVTRSFTEPIERSVVAAPEAGVIQSLLVKEGTPVKAGDILAKTDHAVVQHSLRLAQARSKSTAALDAAKSRMELLRAQKETIESLIDGGHVNKYELQQKVSEFENSVAEYRIAQDEQVINRIDVDRIQAQLERRFIASPIDGVVIEIHKRPGEHVSSTEPQFATVVNVDALKCRFYLNEDMLDQMTIGEQVTVEVGRQRRKVAASVSYVSPVINADSGTGRLDVRIENPGQTIRSGAVCYWIHETGSTKRRENLQNASRIDRLDRKSPHRIR